MIHELNFKSLHKALVASELILRMGVCQLARPLGFLSRSENFLEDIIEYNEYHQG